MTVNGVPCAWFRWVAFLWMLYFSIWLGSVTISHWSSELCLDVVFQLIVLSLGMAISFNLLLSFTFLNDFFFRWRATCCSIVMRLRNYITCLIFPRKYFLPASWFRWISRWFVASLFISFGYFFSLPKIFWDFLYVITVGH